MILDIELRNIIMLTEGLGKSKEMKIFMAYSFKCPSIFLPHFFRIQTHYFENYVFLRRSFVDGKKERTPLIQGLSWNQNNGSKVFVFQRSVTHPFEL